MEKLNAIEPKKRSSVDPFINIDGVDLRKFWEWAYSSLLTNVVRGVIAEFLVAHKLGITETEEDIRKEEWDPYDLDYCGKKIEIKSASYIQTWKQEKCSEIKFNIAKKKSWDRKTNEWSNTKQRNCDIYVFCLLAEKCKPDPTNVQHWKFYVVDTKTLNEKYKDYDESKNRRYISLSALKGMVKDNSATKVSSYDELKIDVDNLIKLLN